MYTSRLARARRVTLFIAAMYSLSGCGGLTRNIQIDRLDEAGSVHVSVLSVIPFDVYKAELQPKFALNEAEALAKAIPNTATFEERIVDAIAVRAKLATPTATLTDTLTQTTTGGTRTLTTGDKPGEVTTDPTSGATQVTEQTTTTPDTSFGEDALSAAGTRTAAGIASGLPSGTKTGNAPTLEYLAATALFQEVKLLNKYVEFAAMGNEKDVDAYVVRLQVTLMPGKRALGLDAYSNIAFFDNPPATMEPIRALSTGVESKLMAVNERRTADVDQTRVKILPLFVTDNIESIIESRSHDSIRRLSLALAASLGGIGVGADFDAMNERLASAIGSELNSTFTIGRLTDNTIRCRFGATATPAERGTIGYAMVPQTHSVTVLVVRTPKSKDSSPRQLRLLANTSFVDVENGKPLPPRSTRVAYKDLHSAAKRCGIPFGARNSDEQTLLLLSRFAEDNDYDAFVENYKSFTSRFDDIVDPATAWTEFAAWQLGSSYTDVTFSPPSPPEMRLPPVLIGGKVENRAFVVSDKKAATVTIVGGGAGLDAFPLFASIERIVQPGETSKEPSLRGVAAVKYGDNGGTLRATFPPLTRLGEPDSNKLQVRLLRRSDKDGMLIPASGADDVFKLENRSAPEGAPDATSPGTLVASVPYIVANSDGTATLRVKLKFDKAVKGHFNVSGAEIDGSSGIVGTADASRTPLPLADDGYSVAAGGTYNLSLRGLAPFGVVTVTFDGVLASDEPAGKATLTLPVVPPQPTPK